MIKKASDMKRDFLGWCKKQYQKCNDFDCCYVYEYILSNPENIKNYLVVLKDRIIIDFIHIDSELPTTKGVGF